MGDIWEAVDLETQKPVAIKLVQNSEAPKEHKKDVNELVMELHRESESHRLVAKFSRRVPKHYGWHCDEKSGPFIVMEMLGPDLGSVRNKTGHKHKKMTVSCVSRIGQGAVDCLKDLHTAGYVHRDMKPQNFLLGPLGSKTEMEVFMVDFGFVKRHLDPKTNLPVPPEHRPNYRGTAPYSSMRALMFHDQGRRDDLEGLFFVLAELLLGGLPWSRVIRDVCDKRERDRAILEQKREFINAAKILCNDHHFTKRMKTPYDDGAFCGPEATRITTVSPGDAVRYIPPLLLRFLVDVHKMQYDSMPDYDTLRGYLIDTERHYINDCNKHFKTMYWQDSYKAEMLTPLYNACYENDADCIDFYCNGVCYNRRCRNLHQRSAAPVAILDAFRCKRGSDYKDMGDEKSGPPPVKILRVQPVDYQF